MPECTSMGLVAIEASSYVVIIEGSYVFYDVE